MSNLAYVHVAYSDPGFVHPKPLIKQATSSTLKVPSPRIESNSDRVEALESGNSESHDERFRNLSDSSHNPHSLKLEDLPSKESPNSDRARSSESFKFSLSSSLSPNKQVMKIERISLPRPEISKAEEEDVVIRVSSNSEESQDFPPRFCLVCNLDQPVRARHCTSCKKCVFKWDHHCTWLGNCIGERNYLGYWLYLVLQSYELSAAVYYLILHIGESVHMIVTILLLIVLCPLCVFALFLTGFHCYLIGRNLTTAECRAWQRTYYLAGKAASPFDRGCLRNVAIFCTWPRVRDWNRYRVNV